MSDQTASTTQTAQQSSGQQSQSASTQAASGDGSQTTQTQAASRPEYVPDQFWDPATNTVKVQEFTTHIGELAALKAAQDARLAARPEKPDGYKLELPQTFKSDVALKFDETDPRVAPLRAIAHELNLDQPTFSRLLEVEATRVIAEQKQIAEAQAAEMKKLGTNAAARVTSAKTFLAGVVGTEGAQQIIDRLVLASDIELVEKLQQAFTNPGGSTFKGNGRDTSQPPPPKTLAEAMWPSMPGKVS